MSGQVVPLPLDTNVGLSASDSKRALYVSTEFPPLNKNECLHRDIVRLELTTTWSYPAVPVHKTYSSDSLLSLDILGDNDSLPRRSPGSQVNPMRFGHPLVFVFARRPPCRLWFAFLASVQQHAAIDEAGPIQCRADEDDPRSSATTANLDSYGVNQSFIVVSTRTSTLTACRTSKASLRVPAYSSIRVRDTPNLTSRTSFIAHVNAEQSDIAVLTRSVPRITLTRSWLVSPLPFRGKKAWPRPPYVPGKVILSEPLRTRFSPSSALSAIQDCRQPSRSSSEVDKGAPGCPVDKSVSRTDIKSYNQRLPGLLKFKTFIVPPIPPPRPRSHPDIKTSRTQSGGTATRARVRRYARSGHVYAAVTTVGARARLPDAPHNPAAEFTLPRCDARPQVKMPGNFAKAILEAITVVVVFSMNGQTTLKCKILQARIEFNVKVTVTPTRVSNEQIVPPPARINSPLAAPYRYCMFNQQRGTYSSASSPPPKDFARSARALQHVRQIVKHSPSSHLRDVIA
ncbi:hypothetical protein C8T65DRAFT_699278 [Cerioporus squamosus]|nr:hypothetical protein C8T65DRAFT_699278 [Cerioporus squamosus]